MPVDLAPQPNDPPEGCRRPLLWRVARGLWEAHRPDCATFCMAATCRSRHELHPCPTAMLAIEALCVATLRLAPTPQIADIGEQIKAGELDPVEAAAEALWRHREYRQRPGPQSR